MYISIANVHELPETERISGKHWGAAYKSLTPSMRPLGGRLGVNHMRLPPGRTACPFHYHQREDEVVFILSGRGILRYGEELKELRAGDCVSCPAGTKVAHQIANPFSEDLVYLAIGPYDGDEVCVYPDSGKIMIRSLQSVGRLTKTDYLEGEPEVPKVFNLLET